MGAQPSDPVQRILFRAGLLPPPPMLAMSQKGGPRDTRPIDPMTGRFATSKVQLPVLNQSEGAVDDETENAESSS